MKNGLGSTSKVWIHQGERMAKESNFFYCRIKIYLDLCITIKLVKFITILKIINWNGFSVNQVCDSIFIPWLEFRCLTRFHKLDNAFSIFKTVFVIFSNVGVTKQPILSSTMAGAIVAIYQCWIFRFSALLIGLNRFPLDQVPMNLIRYLIVMII